MVTFTSTGGAAQGAEATRTRAPAAAKSAALAALIPPAATGSVPRPEGDDGRPARQAQAAGMSRPLLKM